MNNDDQELMEHITAPRGSAVPELGDDQRDLRQVWLGLGDLLAAVEPPPIDVSPRRRRRPWWLAAQTAAAACLLLGVAVWAMWATTAADRAGDAARRDVAAAPSTVAGATAPRANAAGTAWDDSLDDRLNDLLGQLVLTQVDGAYPDDLITIAPMVQQIEAELADDSL